MVLPLLGIVHFVPSAAIILDTIIASCMTVCVPCCVALCLQGHRVVAT